MAEGARRITQLADLIDARCLAKTANADILASGGLPQARIRMIDIGGGLAVDYGSDAVRPSFEDYATLLRAKCPALFSSPGRLIVTGKLCCAG